MARVFIPPFNPNNPIPNNPFYSAPSNALSAVPGSLIVGTGLEVDYLLGTINVSQGGGGGGQGPVGPAGPQGVQGPTGPAGIQGPIGLTGPQGPAGIPGPTGATGATGATGPAGVQGIQGVSGVQGIAGPTGGVGPGIDFQGVVATVGDLPSPSTQGFGYIVQADNEFYIYDASNNWVSAGEIQGPQGIQGIQGVQGIQGAPGNDGAAGAPGTVGPTGPAGPIGPAGTVGPTGPEGPAGPAGVQGPTGAQGPIGADGPAGPQGPAGPEGPQGSQGPEGPEGPEGPAGATGAAGAQGEAGPAGATGPQGPVGPAGPQGDVGPAGGSGDQGLTGAVGPAGADGATGPTGPQGPQGIQGVVGPQGGVGPGIVFQGQVATPGDLPTPSTLGYAYLVQSTDSLWIYDATDTWIDGGSIQGPQGIQGEQGPTGATGDTGATGPAGPQGETGATGPAGPQGEVGPAGPAGAQGFTGPQGAQGPTGATGQGQPVGTVSYFASTTAPEGWIVCDGRSLSRLTYYQLFEVIGTTFGSVSSTTFQVPNLQGKFLRGWNSTSGGIDPGRLFGSTQTEQFKSHTHGVNDGGHQHSIAGTGGSVVGGTYTLATTNADQPSTTLRNWKANATTANISIYNNGGAETRPTNVALLPCICAVPAPGVLVQQPAMPNTLGAVYGNATMALNTVVGYDSGASLELGSANNVFLGVNVGTSLTGGRDNIAIGEFALENATDVSYNIAIGPSSLSLLDGDNATFGNIGIGYNSWSTLTEGSNNIGLGVTAGGYFSSGYGNVIIGNYGGNDITGGTYPDNAIVLSPGGDPLAKLILNEDGALSFSEGIQDAEYGVSGQVLQSNGPGARPTWVNAGGFQTYPIARRSTLSTVNTGSFSSVVVIYDVADVSNIVAQYNEVNGRFQPTLAGFWTIQASARCYDDVTQEANVRLVKNGTTQMAICGSFGQVTGNVAATIYLNGTTDYVTVNVTTATAATNIQTSSYFSAYYVGN